MQAESGAMLSGRKVLQLSLTGHKIQLESIMHLGYEAAADPRDIPVGLAPDYISICLSSDGNKMLLFDYKHKELCVFGLE